MTPVVDAPAVGSRPAADPYPPAVRRFIPGMRRSFLVLNRSLAVPLLRAGLGPVFSTPLAGSLMLLRTRGRRTGRWREAPLGYVIREGSVYCCAGFGVSTYWLRNVEADPRVEVLLPGRAHAGVAEVVTDPAEGIAALRALLASMPLVSRPLLGDTGTLSDAELDRMREAIPVVRIRVTGIAAGPWDPGGPGWILSSAAWLLALGLTVRWLRRMGSRPT